MFGRNIGEYLKEHPFINKLENKEEISLFNCNSEKELIENLRKYYKNDFTEEDLNTQLILLENMKLGLNKASYVSIIVSFISLIVAFLATISSFSGKAIDAINSLKDSGNAKFESAKHVYMTNYNLMYQFSIAFVIFVVILILILLLENWLNTINTKKLKVINIHKSIIEEKLKK